MKIVLVPSSVSERSEDQHQFLTSYLINDTLAVDAGCLGLNGTAQEQARIRHVLISHTHIDHIGSLPIFVENAYEGKRDCVTIHGNEAVLSCLQKDLFNDRVWPDFIRMSTENAPFLKLAKLEAGKTVELEGLRITPVPVNHVVQTFGFIIEDRDSAVAIVSDTGPTDAIWDHANTTPNLKAVFLEATFPESLTWLAEVSTHLTPALFAREVQKLKKPAAIVAVHIKARFRNEVVNELKALGLSYLQIGRFGKPYTF
jgi:ribonuclease BN (tRNA processing enzyme)